MSNFNKNWKKFSLKSAPSPKIQKDYKPSNESVSTAPKQHERQKTIKTDASLVDKLGALQMALGYKNRTETFKHLLKTGVYELLKGQPTKIARYREAYKLLHD